AHICSSRQRYRLLLKPVKKDSITYACRIAGTGGLKSHEPPVRRNNGIGCFSAVVVVEVSQTDKIFSCSIEPELPNIDISGTAPAAKLLALPVSLHGGVRAIGKDALGLVVRSRRFRKIRHLSGLQIYSHHGRCVVWLVAG